MVTMIIGPENGVGDGKPVVGTVNDNDVDFVGGDGISRVIKLWNML